MVLTWALTVAGFILILLELKGLSETISSNPHAIIGFVTVGLCFIQPFLALVRCSPNHHLRPLFNWVHWFIGKLVASSIYSMSKTFLFQETWLRFWQLFASFT